MYNSLNKKTTSSSSLCKLSSPAIYSEHLSPKFNDCGEAAVETFAEETVPSLSRQVNKSPTVITFSNLHLSENNEIDNENSSSYGNKLLLSGELFFNKEIIIDKNGMLNGLRRKKDGQTFFGLTNSKDYTGTFYNDLVLNFPLNKRNNTSTGRVFDISYQKKTNDYRLYMIHNAMIINYQITNRFYFEDEKEYYLVLGKIFVTINTKKIENKKIIEIAVETEVEGEDDIKFTYKEDEMPISIGRANCDVSIHNTSVSKKHAIIDISPECGLFCYRDLGSTNGSVVVIKEDDTLKLKGDMRFKLEDVSFRILELP